MIKPGMGVDSYDPTEALLDEERIGRVIWECLKDGDSEGVIEVIQIHLEAYNKTQLAKEKLNGVMFWEIAQDTVHEMSLLRAVDQTIQAGNCDVTTFYKDEDGDGLGDPSRPFQACEAPEGYVDNRDDMED